MTSMIQQSERPTPDPRYSNQQRVHGSLTPGITNSPDLPPTPPPLTIQPQNFLEGSMKTLTLK